MGADNITQCLLFPKLIHKPLQVEFDEPQTSSDGGAILLKAADAKLGLTANLAACLTDERQPGKVKHSIEDLLRQRIFGLACGYADGNDAARLSTDPVFKLLLERDPLTGGALSSQPTLSRFENQVGPRANYRLALAFATTVLHRQTQRRPGRRRPRHITIDLDSTADPTHGHQQLTFFNAFYDCYCYLPLLGFVSFDAEPEQYLALAVLRPSNETEKAPVVVRLAARFISLVRAAFPKAKLKVRLDAGFAGPEMFDYLDRVPHLKYACGLAKNSVLQRYAEPLLKPARKRAKRSKQSARIFGEHSYRAGSWTRSRRVVIKAEVTRNADGKLKDNPRFVVTNHHQSPKFVYQQAYCSRGEIENRIKELQHDLEIDRTSCSSFWANQFRVTLTAAAYALLQEIRTHAKGTSLARAQACSLRLHLLKLSARVAQSVRRCVLHLSATCAFLKEWTRIARQLGAAPT